ncbi:MAG: alpha-ketoglutarate-dependent dioxygenase AlkB [Flavobacterium sp.]|nr:MAG: alpha-ketoglutarate-dependent dioxygenase AlkB [Flavobacterium sp.]
MTLFDETDLFQTGNPAKIEYDLPDAEITLYDGFFDKVKSDQYYRTLMAETNWREHEMTVYGQSHVVPRMIAWYEDAENPGANPSRILTADLQAIRDRVNAETGLYFNSVLLNLYRNGGDGVGWHSDREKNFGKDAIIASITFGQTRPFRLRHKLRKDLQLEILLKHGSFLLMSGTTQSFWEHQIPKSARPMSPRINLTFRQVKRDEF